MRRFLLVIAAALGLLLAASAAQAASRTAIIRDCEDDSKLSGTYTAKELRDARSNLPSDKDAYSDCRDVLGAALAASAARSGGLPGGPGPGSGNALEGGSGLGGGTGAAGAVSPTPPAPPLDLAPGAAPIAVTAAEHQALRDARATPPRVGRAGRRSVAGVRAVAGQAATATIPPSLAVVLALLGVTVLLAAVPSIHRRVVRRRTA